MVAQDLHEHDHHSACVLRRRQNHHDGRYHAGRTDEQWCNAVAVESGGLVLPLAHHGEQPRGEPLAP